MRIENLRKERRGNRARVAATVSWEDCDRPAHEVYFETNEVFADSLSCNPHAFLVGNIVPAMHYGEKRVFIDAEICPELRDGLITAMSWLRHWFYRSDRKTVQIEGKVQSSILTCQQPQRAGFFFSGGIDSFATLRANRLSFPLDHPWSIKDGLLVYGLEMDEPESFEYVVDSLSEVTQVTQITLIPIYTNLYLNYRDEDTTNGFVFWMYEFQGAALAAIAHAFSQRFSVISIASSDDIPNLCPYGSHPMLDPNYSSADLRIRHDGVTLSRLAKTKLVADWDLALRHLRVCNQYKWYEADKLNCGCCEKCVRTMLALLSLGVLDHTQAFREQDVSEELLRTAVHINKDYIHYYQELIEPLTERGRFDLVHIIEQKIAECHKHKKRRNRIAGIRQFDRQYFNGNLVRFKRLISTRKRIEPATARARKEGEVL